MADSARLLFLCVQLNVGHTDANGVYTGAYTTVAFCGQLRGMGEADVALNRYDDRADARLRRRCSDDDG